MTCSAHAHQGSWMRPNAHALVHHVHRAHRVGGTLNSRPHSYHPKHRAMLPLPGRGPLSGCPIDARPHSSIIRNLPTKAGNSRFMIRKDRCRLCWNGAWHMAMHGNAWPWATFGAKRACDSTWDSMRCVRPCESLTLCTRQSPNSGGCTHTRCTPPPAYPPTYPSTTTDRPTRIPPRLVTSVRQVTHDQMEPGPTGS